MAMKGVSPLKLKSLTLLLSIFLSLGSATAMAATFSIAQLLGNAQYAPSLYGQTFLVPVGYSGTISNVSSLAYEGYGNTVASVIWAKVWNSPSKTSLLATSSNTFTGPTNPGGWTSRASFSLNFPTFDVTGGTTYYLEIGRSTGNGNFYIHESGANPYAGGSAYHDGTIISAYDLKFQLDITYSIEPLIPSTPNLTFSALPQKGVSLNIVSTAPVAGFLNFKVNKRNIPKCQKVRASGSPLTASCSWKPSVRGVSLISVYLIPSDTATYQNSGVVTYSVLVSNRNNQR